MDNSHIISATDAARSFSEIINRVYYQGQSFNIKKGKAIVARITPCQRASTLATSDLAAFFMNAPRLDEVDRKEFESQIEQQRKAAKIRDIEWD